MIAVVWQFQVKAGQQDAFEKFYGADGEWTDLGRKSRSFLGASFLRDQVNDTHYLLIEYLERDGRLREAPHQFRRRPEKPRGSSRSVLRIDRPARHLQRPRHSRSIRADVESQRRCLGVPTVPRCRCLRCQSASVPGVLVHQCQGARRVAGTCEVCTDHFHGTVAPSTVGTRHLGTLALGTLGTPKESVFPLRRARARCPVRRSCSGCRASG